MERLSGLDASFLYLETPSLHLHVSMAAVLDPATVPGGYRFDKLRDFVGERLIRAPVFRRRLVHVPLGMDHPYWVDDGQFDLDYHLRRAALPSPGGMAELATFVGDVCSRQLDRSKPLWEMYVVEGLEGGLMAVVTKIHHCTIDGVSGAELLAQLFDLDAAGTGSPGGEPPRPEHAPSEWEMVGRAVVSRLVRPFEMTRLAVKTGRAALGMVRIRRSPRSARAALPLTTPRTSLNQAITPHRAVAFSSTSLDDVKRLKNALGCTVNDVVLAVCAGALRRYLAAGDELPDQPLVATVPMSVAGKVDRPGANKVSAMFVSLPCAEPDPLERVARIAEGSRGSKEEYNALGADVLMDWTEHAPPNLFALAARAYSQLRLADVHRPIHSLVISNVPGPDVPIFLGGAELVAGFPLGPVMDGAGLNVTVMSYRGVLNWGLIACADTVPRLAELAEAVPAALDELLEAAGLERAAPVGVAPPGGASRRRRSSGGTPRPPTATTTAKKATAKKSAAKKSAAKKSAEKETQHVSGNGRRPAPATRPAAAGAGPGSTG